MVTEAAGGRAERPAARILVVDRAGRVLLLRFAPADRPALWCTPGGAVDPGESYPQAARRELWEEVGLDMDCGPEVARRVVDFVTFDGVEVTADERYFRLDVDMLGEGGEVRGAALTAFEQAFLSDARWFTPEEIAGWGEPIYPADLVQMVVDTRPGR